MEIEKLNIVAIYPTSTLEKVNYIKINEPSTVKYLETNAEDFVSYLNNPLSDFSNHNKYTLYIIKGGNYIDIKNIFSHINGFDTNVGRGSSQKVHIISPLDFRLYCYLLAMFKFNYRLISYLNTFNDIPKCRYLPYIDLVRDR